MTLKSLVFIIEIESLHRSFSVVISGPLDIALPRLHMKVPICICIRSKSIFYDDTKTS